MRNRMLMIGLSVLSMTGTAMAGAMLDVKLACGNEGQKMQGQMSFESANGETVSGTIDMKGSGEGGDFALAMRVKGKWLGADCGGVE